MTRRDQLLADVRAFHVEHPEVWEHFRAFTMELIRRGRTHYSADAVMHRVRWETDAGADARGGESLKINNNHVAFYARRFNRMYPEYGEFFRTREQTSGERVPA